MKKNHQIQVIYNKDRYTSTDVEFMYNKPSTVLQLINTSLKEAKRVLEGLKSGDPERSSFNSLEYGDFYGQMMVIRNRNSDGVDFIWVDIAVWGESLDRSQTRHPERPFWRSSIQINEKDWVWATRKEFKVGNYLKNFIDFDNAGHHLF